MGSSFFRNEGLLPINYNDESRLPLLVPSAVAAFGALVALLALSRLPRLLAWSPSFRRHFPTLWPVRTPLA
jgi:hypothetical protein